MNRDCLKYACVATVVWNVVLFSLVCISAYVRKVGITYFFDDGTGGVGMCLFLVLWSIGVFAMGYHLRKKYIEEREFYRKQAPTLGKEVVEKELRRYCLLRVSKQLAILTIVAVPWYFIVHVRDAVTTFDICAMSLLFVFSVVLFVVYKRCKAAV